MSQTQTAHEDPAVNDDLKDEHTKKEKSRRPPNTAFRQQRLKAWQPILTPKTVLPLFFAIGVIFAPIGGLLLWSSAKVQELSIDYTHCFDQAPNRTAGDDSQQAIPSKYVSSEFKRSNATSQPMWWNEVSLEQPEHSVRLQTNVCTLQFDIPNDIGPPVFLYYRLTNFYQNHRRYVKSLDTDQLMGSALSNKSISTSECNPLRDTDGIAIYPCGLIANSIFNDTFLSPVDVTPTTGTNVTYEMTNKGIAWDHDKNIYKKTKYTLGQVVPPPNWAKRYPDGYTEDNPIPDLSQYEEFQNWMRTAGLPTFSKLALRNDTSAMGAGTYTMRIFDYFPMTEFGGTKSLLISTRTVMGGKNSFLGIAYVAIGGLCIVLGALFTVAHLIKPRKLGDHTYLSWNNDRPATATTTGRDTRAGA